MLTETQMSFIEAAEESEPDLAPQDIAMVSPVVYRVVIAAVSPVVYWVIIVSWLHRTLLW